MKTFSFLVLLFLFLMNNQNKDNLGYNQKYNSNFKKYHLIKNDSISNIPASFLEFQKNSKGYCLVHGNSTTKQIALTFDDGPTEVPQKIIKILNKYNAQATFFWVGERIQDNENIIQSAKENGHLIANYSWNHENAYTYSNQLLWKSQIEKTLHIFSDYGINEVFFYRPPFGAITQKQIDFLATKNIKTVLWSTTTMDWDPNENSDGQIFQKFKENLHPGSIVLMHDFDFGNLDSKLEDLKNILKYGRSKGYKFLTVAEFNL